MPDSKNPPPPMEENQDNPVPVSSEEGEEIVELPVLPSRQFVLFPDMVLPLSITDPREIQVVDEAVLQSRSLAVIPFRQAPPNGEPLSPAHLYSFGCKGMIVRLLKFPDGSLRLLLQGMQRIRILKYLRTDPYWTAQVELIEDEVEDSLELDARHRHLRDRFRYLIDLLPQFPEEVKIASLNIADPGHFADLVANHIHLTLEERCTILGETNVIRRIQKLSVWLEREIQIVEIGSKIQEDVKQKIEKGQRDYFLREQMAAIRRELGESDIPLETEELAKALEEAGLPEEARKEADRELKRLERMQPGSAEYTVARTYLDWMIALPWNKETPDCLDIPQARRILDEDHYDLEKIKERILEFLAVRKLHPEGRSPILCFLGPPGVGKTSLGKSIARAMGRTFVRISLGGVHDEAEIRGHRRTYIGALPGRIIQGLRKAGTRNPVFMMDEIDKLGHDIRGDPASALLEVLDPEQNHAFTDHYLDVAFDLSKVIFIATGNQSDTIPPALLDRMEVLRLSGYAREEKIHIARHYLLPRVLAEHGLGKQKVKIRTSTLREILSDYTREAGLRNFEREIATLARKIAVRVASGENGPFIITPSDLKKYLGPPRFFPQTAVCERKPGVAIGLVWTPVGGDILFIEAMRMPGERRLYLTGSLGDVLKESAYAAMSWIRAHADELEIPKEIFDTSDIHIHVPEGATPKDGPSAGIALVASLVSLLTHRPIPPRLAMTGEITLRGRVLPVGGIKEKMLGARRAGIRTVLLPAENLPDLDELPAEVRNEMTFHPLHEIEEMLTLAFPQRGTRKQAASSPRSSPLSKRKSEMPTTEKQRHAARGWRYDEIHPSGSR